MKIGINIFKRISLIVLMVINWPVQAEETIKYVKLIAADESVASALILSDVDAQDQTFNDYRGQTTIIHFWATWCVPCVKELPELEAFDQRYNGKKVQVKTIAADSHDAVKVFLLEHNTKLNVLIDQYGSAMRDFKVKVLPSSYVVNKQGKLKLLAQGPVDWESKKTQQLINQLISQP